MNTLRVGRLNIGIIRSIFYYFAAKRNFAVVELISPFCLPRIGKSMKFRSTFHENFSLRMRILSAIHIC